MTDPTTTALLATEQVGKQFPLRAANGRQVLLQAVTGVDLAVAPGSTLGLVGESGCGKSTLARLLTGLLTPSSGRVLFQGADLATLDRERQALFRRSVQLIFQDPYASLNPRQRIGDAIGEPLLVQRLARRNELRERVTPLLERVGLTANQYDRYPHQFSGGQRQRIGIARALAAAPQLIVADEPVSALDLSVQAQILNLLRELRLERGLAFVLISHDLRVIRHMSDTVAVMYLGRIVEQAPVADLFRRPRHPYGEALLAAAPRLDGGPRPEPLAGDLPSPLQPPAGCPFHPRCPHAIERCRQELPPLQPERPGHLAACHRSAELYGRDD